MKIDYVDPLSMNSTTDLTDYNCAGFALKTFDWENLDSFDSRPDDIDLMLNNCEEELLKICPKLKRIRSHTNVPSDIDVIGFRVAFEEITIEEKNDDDSYTIIDCEDFHFILRAHGKWYHKPGSNTIKEVDFPIEEPWPHIGSPYNSEILWFERA
jgi:hypothetical protein